MASEAPIGIFDSGIGGLTVAHALAQAWPAERLHYFGDTAHMPYGDRSPELVCSWSVRIAEHLVDSGCKAIVVACNSASATATAAVQEAVGPAVPVIDVITPVVAHVAAGPARRVGVIGTRATVGSGVYGRSLTAAMNEHPGGRGDRTVEEWPTPCSPPDRGGVARPRIDGAGDFGTWRLPLVEGAGVFIPGCTHYPLALSALRQVFGADVDLVDGPTLVAEAVGRRLMEAALLASPSGTTPEHRFAVSDLTPSFADSARRFFGSGIRLERDPLWD